MNKYGMSIEPMKSFKKKRRPRPPAYGIKYFNKDDPRITMRALDLLRYHNNEAYIKAELERDNALVRSTINYAGCKGNSLIADNTTLIQASTLTKGQRVFEDLFDKWFATDWHRHKQVLRIGAQAGFGKSYMIKYLIQKYDLNATNCAVMAYTGKAINTLRENGVLARTIHSVTMRAKDVPTLDENGKQIVKKGIPVTHVEFIPIKHLPDTYKLLIIDEASFLPESMEQQLLEYGIPILEVGDPIQLPPVSDAQAFSMKNLDLFAEGIMRQNRDSEIIDLATRIRFHKDVDTSIYRKDVRFLYQQSTLEETFVRFLPFFRGADQIVCANNTQRQTLNDLYRKYIVGTTDPYPKRGERVICRRNNNRVFIEQYMLTNGTIGTVLHNVGKSNVNTEKRTFTMDFLPDTTKNIGAYYDGLVCDADYIREQIDNHSGISGLNYYPHPGEKFEYAYALTAHLLQGSTVNSILFVDVDRTELDEDDYAMRLKYTAVTRARDHVYYMIPYDRTGNNYFILRNIERIYEQYYEWRKYHGGGQRYRPER